PASRMRHQPDQRAPKNRRGRLGSVSRTVALIRDTYRRVRGGPARPRRGNTSRARPCRIETDRSAPSQAVVRTAAIRTGTDTRGRRVAVLVSLDAPPELP